MSNKTYKEQETGKQMTVLTASLVNITSKKDVAFSLDEYQATPRVRRGDQGPLFFS